jgi:hypothetical protein
VTCTMPAGSEARVHYNTHCGSTQPTPACRCTRPS